MRVREVIITDQENVIDISQAHPNIKKVWTLPRKIVLFEFYHSLNELLYNNDPNIVKKAYEDKKIFNKMAEVKKIKYEIFKPLYKKIADSSKQVMLFIPTISTNYFFLGKNKDKISWPEIDNLILSKKNWELQKNLNLSIFIKAINPKKKNIFNEVLIEWENFCIKEDIVSNIDLLKFEDSNIFISCQFKESCGDAFMALYMIITKLKNDLSIKSIIIKNKEKDLDS